MREMQALSLLPFPGPPLPELVSGLTPPHDQGGQTLDMGQPMEWLHRIPHQRNRVPWRVYWTRQVHGREVIALTGAEAEGAVGTADALVTNQPGVLLVTRHADCAPVLFWDPRLRALGLAHSGRRGTLANIAGTVIDALSARYGTRPRDLQVFIGAGIRSCCYEIKEDVAGDLRAANGDRYLTQRQGSTYFDGPRMIEVQCRDAGVAHIHGALDGECTCCGPSRFHSYRRDGTMRRFAAIVGMPR